METLTSTASVNTMLMSCSQGLDTRQHVACTITQIKAVLTLKTTNRYRGPPDLTATFINEHIQRPKDSSF
jgi:hypothetical protein